MHRFRLDLLLAVMLLALSLPVSIQAQTSVLSAEDSLHLTQLRKAAVSFYGTSYPKMDSAGHRYLAAAEKLGSKANIMSAYQLLGTSKLETGNYGEALDLFIQSLQIAEELGKESYKATAFNNIATTFHFQGRLEDALGYYLKALPGFNSGKLLRRKAQILYNVAIIYQDLGEADSAINYYQEGIRQAEESDDIRALADLYNGLGNLVMDQGEEKEAKLYLGKALKYADETKDAQRRFYPLLNLGIYAAEDQAYQQARKHLQEARAIAYELESLDMKIDAEEALSTLEKKVGNFEDAYQHLQILSTLRKEKVTLEQETQLSLLQEEFDTRQKELRIAANERVIAKQSETIRLKSFLNLGLGLIVVLILLIAIGYWRIGRARKRHTEVLYALNQEKDDMLHAVAHDLQSPTVNIRGLADILLSEGQSIETTSILNMMVRELDKSDHLVKNLLDLESIESGDLSLEIEPVSMANLLLAVEEKYQKLAQRKNIRIQTEGEAEIIHSDQGFIERILDNLISNAIKFSPSGSEVRIRMTSEAEKVVINIKDEGPGFNQEDKSRMYGRFQRLTAQPTGGETSVGLGLAITKALVERLSGTITLKSEPGEGSEFAVSIPTYS